MKPQSSTIAVLAFLVLLALAPQAAGGPRPDDEDVVFGTVGGLRYAADEMSYDDTDSALFFTGCGPSGRFPVGGGTDTRGPVGQTWIRAAFPFGDAWYSQAVGPPGGTFDGYSICVDEDVPYRSKYRDDPDQRNGRRVSRSSCAIPGWGVAGGGGALYSDDSWLHSSFPVDGKDPDHVRDDGWQARGWDDAGGIGQFEAYVTCVRDVDVRTVRLEPVGVDAGGTVTRRVACPSDEHVTGGGAAVTGAQERARLVATFPYDGADADDIPDDGWQVRVDNLAAGNKNVRAFAICLRADVTT